MVQIFIIAADRKTEKLLKESDYELLNDNLISAVEDGFGIKGQNDVSATAIQSAIWTRGEATVQMEVRYIAEEWKNDGRAVDFFDPSFSQREKTAHAINREFKSFLESQGLPPMLLSVLFVPLYGSMYVPFTEM